VILSLGPILLALAAGSPAAPPFDVVIRGGRIVDGAGRPAFTGDLAIEGDRIVAVGTVPAGRGARRVIDARGLVVAPGFVDVHSHSDLLYFEDGRAESKVRQGVTLEVLGEADSAGPCQGRLVADGRSCFRTLGDYFRALEAAGMSVNVASYVGHANVWRSVMGDAFDRPTPAQLEEMKALVAQAMEDGALGLSSMLAGPPGLLATTDDIVALAGAVRPFGGIYSTHIRNEGTGVQDAVREAIAIGERAGVPVDIIHLKIADQTLWGRMGDLVALVEQARARGVDVQANVYPYTRGNNNLASIVPPWAHEGGTARMLERLRDPAARERMKRDIRAGLEGWYNHYTAIGGDWARMLVNGELSDANARFEGRTMDVVLARRSEGRTPPPDPIDEMLDFLLEEGGSVPTIYAHHTEEDMTLAMRQRWCSIGSDGLAHATDGPLRRGTPHPRSFGTFPRVLGVYARERGLLTLEEAVRKMTSLNARKVGLADRGELRPGAFADVVVFDGGRVIDRSTYLEPFQYPEGIDFVIVNGRVVVEGSRHTGERPGRVVRREAVERSVVPSSR